MKAKDLAGLLMENPDAEVVMPIYNGGCDPLTEISGVLFESKGSKTSCHDGGAFIHRDGTTKCDIVQLISKNY